MNTVSGVPRGALPLWLIRKAAEAKLLVLLSDETDVASLVDDIRGLSRLPEDWALPREVPTAAYEVEDETQRSRVLFDWIYGKTRLLVASHEGLDVPCDAPADLRSKTFLLKPGLTINRPAFEEILAQGGYSRSDRAEQTGEYAIRGDVIDIWPPSMETPARITWNFDTVESIRDINLYTQRSEEYRPQLLLHPAAPGSLSTLRQSVPADAQTVLFGGPSDASTAVSGALLVTPSADPSGEGFEPPPLFAGHIDRLREQLQRWHDDDWRLAIFCHNRGEKERLEELLTDALSLAKGLRPEWIPPMIIGELEHGFLHPAFRWAVLSNSEIFGRYRKRVRLPKFSGGETVSSPLDIRTNDYLVHEKHGIGRYLGLQTINVGNILSEYLALEYKGGDKLYVPIFEIQQVQKYLGAEGRRPALSSLDAASWEKIKAKVKEDVAELAADLLRKAAKRSLRPGHSFPLRSHLEDEFAASFMYKLTVDQEKTLAEVERDMVSPKPMDRLVCGDVGFGKTEIAMRAALKAALAAKQVCVLCPTTILAEQHARNFSERMADYPVNVKLLSRFQDKSEQREVIEALAKGRVDIIVGTHRLLSADIVMPNLGLLIIDEEHRFGVKQKSKLLALRETVDVLSLTATPIPRTLASSLSGIKDLSVIETPPTGRLPISTHVGVFDEDLMVQAVQRELDRGGQVFYVHNRVGTLTARRDWLQSVLPSIRIAMAHGQMKEDELETAMHDFLHKKVDVLLATTIIESGLDIPSVNTLVVEEAEEMGLAQLYQLRGRVGRSSAKAYCYLFHGLGGLTTDARKRLDALKEFSSLGSGLRLAMRDMEIRGAGNLLGPQQHGDIAAVGVETYSQMLNEEIQKQKGEAVEEANDGPILELSLSAYLPDDYLPSEMERVQMYKRILSSASAADLQRIKEELVERCGPMPEPAHVLCQAANLRLKAKAMSVSDVHEDADGILIYFKANHKIPEPLFKKLVAASGDTWSLIPGPPSAVRVFTRPNEEPLQTLERFFSKVG